MKAGTRVYWAPSPDWGEDMTATSGTIRTRESLDGERVHVDSHGPEGWDAVVLFTSGTVLTVTDERGRRHLIDTSKTTVRTLAAA